MDLYLDPTVVLMHFVMQKSGFLSPEKASWYNINVGILKVLVTMEDKEILKQFKEISNNLMSRCSPDSEIYPLVTALIFLFNLVINITQSLKENFETQTKNFESQINFFKELAQKSEDQAKKSEEENKNLKLMIKELQGQLSNSTIINVKLAYEAINGKGSEKNKPNTEAESESTQPEDDDKEM